MSGPLEDKLAIIAGAGARQVLGDKTDDVADTVNVGDTLLLIPRPVESILAAHVPIYLLHCSHQGKTTSWTSIIRNAHNC
jgi:hypothetical protein